MATVFPARTAFATPARRRYWHGSRDSSKLVVFGHIHEGRGEWRLGETVLTNVTLVNAAYEPWAFKLERT
jgi:hypothetical protein